jgi:uncharacterized protein YndB with AHSA1/START domain
MPDILHRVGIKSSAPDTAYKALTTRDGLAAWWTDDTRGGGAVGDVIQFRFGDGGFDMKILELDGASRVRWQVVDGPADWVGTTIGWKLRQEGGDTIVLFKHEGWREPTEFMHQCSTKWALFLMSLKALVETGTGAPWPRDVKTHDAH